MGYFNFFNCMALAGGPHVIAYKAAGLADHDAFWRCFQIVLLYGFVQLAKMFTATLLHFNFDILSAAGLFNYELLGAFLNLLAVRFIYSYVVGRSEIAVLVGSIGWSFGDLIFARIIPLWTGTHGLEFDWSYVVFSLDANFELIFNFVLFLAPWLLMRKERNVTAACISILTYIIASFHLSIFGLIEWLFHELVYVAAAKFAFALFVGFVGLVLRIVWTTEAHEPKKQSGEPSHAAILMGLLCQLGDLCLQSLRRAVTPQPSSTGRRG